MDAAALHASTSDSLRGMLKAVPFRPFTLRLTDGRRIDVQHPKFVLITHGGRTAVVCNEWNDDFTIVDLSLLAQLDVISPLPPTDHPMSIDQLRARIKARPFVPFTILSADGRSYIVPHEDFVSLSPSGRTVIVYTGEDSHVVLDGLLIAGLEFSAPHETVS